MMALNYGDMSDYHNRARAGAGCHHEANAGLQESPDV